MKVQVIHVRQTPKGANVAYIQAGELFGTVACAPGVDGPGEFELKNKLVVDNGRFEVVLRVEKD